MNPGELPRKSNVLVRKLLDKANGHHAAGRLRDADRAYGRCLELEPGHAAAHHNLGLIAARLGDHPRAVLHHTAALRAAPDQPARWVALAGALLACDRVADARAILERFPTQGFSQETVRSLCRPLVAMLNAIARIRFDAGRLHEAERLLDIVILLDETHAEAVHLAGLIALRTGRPSLAVDLFTIAVYRDAGNARYFADLGSAFRASGKTFAAMSSFEKALELDAARDDTRAALADLYQEEGRLQDAAESWRALAVRRADSPAVHNNLGAVLHRLGNTRDAIAAFERAVVLDPDAAVAHGNLVYATLYAEHLPVEAYAETAREYGRRRADPLLRTRPFANDRSPDRRLRVGFVSADFREHPVVRFVEPFLEYADPARHDLVAYSNVAREDAVTAALKARFGTWRPVLGLDDEALADQIEADRIDILIDLSGQSGGHRLLAFARKPAPVQVTWIGLAATTGLASIDYRLTDAVYDPVGETEQLYSEALWRLPGTGYCYRPFLPAPEVAVRAPFVEKGYVTFGCFNRFEKVTDGTLAAWAAILAAVPDARLMLIVADIDDPRTRAAADARLAAAGLPPDRIVFAPRTASNHYALHGQVDIALDPFPFNGATTTFDTLYMGVPVITLAGAQTVARLGAAILTIVGLPDLIARDVDAYVAIARRLAEEPEELVRLRAGLRERLVASPAMDHRRHAREVSEAFHGMWRRWCAGAH